MIRFITWFDSVFKATSNFINAVNAIVLDAKAYCEFYWSGSQLQSTPASGAFKMTIPTATEGITPKNFEATSANRFTRTSGSGACLITASIIISGATSDRIAFYIAKNGTLLPESKNVARITASGGDDQRSTIIQCLESIAATDYVELWAENETNSDDFTLLLTNTIITTL